MLFRRVFGVSVAGLLLPALAWAQSGPQPGGSPNAEPPAQRRPGPGPGGGPGGFGSGFGGGVMAPPGPVGRDREIEDLKRRVENLESMFPPFRRSASGGGPGSTASGPRGFGGGSSGGFGAASSGIGGFPGGTAPGGFGFGAVSTFGRSTTTATSRSGDDGLAQLNEQIAAKRRELQQLEEQFRARMAERQRQQARPRQDSVEEKLDRLLREVDDIRRELRAPRGVRTGSSRGE